MTDDLELMNFHVRALFTSDADERLLLVNEPSGGAGGAPRLFLGRTRRGNVWRFGADVPKEICEQLGAVCASEPPLSSARFDEPPRCGETLVRLLETHSPVGEASNGLAYRFAEYKTPLNRAVAVTEENQEILRGGFEKLIEELPDWQPFVALVEENRAVSVCRSVRITAEAHEAGVETLPEFRGRSYAEAVVSEWARLVRATGALPLYSTSFENRASQAVARKLGLKCYGATFSVA